MESLHEAARNSLCRICTSIFPRDRPATKLKSRKFLVSDYKIDIEKLYRLEVKESDPPFLCQGCLAYMNCDLKKGHRCMKFVKRLWQRECGDQCDTCEVLEQNRRRKGPKKAFQTNCSFKAVHYAPLQWTYDGVCGVCCKLVAIDATSLPCTHVHCTECLFHAGNSIKCSKCSQVFDRSEASVIPQSVMGDLLCKCVLCESVLHRHEMHHHVCDLKNKHLSWTVENLLQRAGSGDLSSAQQVTSVIVPQLEHDGQLIVKATNGKVL